MPQIVGPEADVANFHVALRTVHNRARPLGFVMGGTGMAAIEHSLEWPNAQPFDIVRSIKSRTSWLRLRDIDVLRPYVEGNQSTEIVHGVEVDYRIGNLFDCGPEPSAAAYDTSLVLIPEFFRPRTRYLDGSPVRTFSLGNYALFMALMRDREHGKEPYKYVQARERLYQLTTWARRTHPNEFSPDDAYRPYVDFMKRAAGIDIARQVLAHPKKTG